MLDPAPGGSRKRRRFVVPALLVVAALALSAAAAWLGWQLGLEETDENRAVSAQEVFASLSLPALADGELLGPPHFEGSVVVLDFWATWCGPCDAQARILELVCAEFCQRGVAFLAVNVGEQPSIVTDFLAEKPYSYPVLLDQEGTTSLAAEVVALPTVVILDRERQIAYQHSGITSAKRLRQVLGSVLEPGEGQS